MKKIFSLVLVLFLLSYTGQTQVKIGIVNAQEILQKSNKGIEIQKKLEKLQQQKQEELQKMQDQIKNLEKDLQSPALNNETREKKSLELQSKRTNLKREYEDAQNYFQRESQKSLLELEKLIVPVIENYGRDNEFTVIYDRERAGIVYFDNAIDITNDLINLLNQQ